MPGSPIPPGFGRRTAELPAPVLDQLVAIIKAHALKLRVTDIVIVGRDPTTGATRLYGDKNNIPLRTLIAEKFDLMDQGETGWDG